ncbi:MAG: hypothetical protein HFJ12_05810 [Bacilli bacterium]|nr:hypothetical protein [Bacilli bacterium]
MGFYEYALQLGPKKLCTDICVNGKSTIKSANEYNVPLKTLEKWITSDNRDSKVFDSDYKSQAQIISDLKKKDSSLERDN